MHSNMSRIWKGLVCVPRPKGFDEINKLTVILSNTLQSRASTLDFMAFYRKSFPFGTAY